MDAADKTPKEVEAAAKEQPVVAGLDSVPAAMDAAIHGAPKRDDRDRGLGAGTAPVKAEYLITVPSGESSIRAVRDDDAAEGRDDGNKRQKTGNGFKTRTTGRAPLEGEATIRLCKAWEMTGACNRPGQCRFIHSWEPYWPVRPTDIHFERGAVLSDTAPFAKHEKEALIGGSDPIGKTVDLNTECPVYADLGYCTFGWRCRFLGGHVEKKGDTWELEGKYEQTESQEGKNDEINWAPSDSLFNLRKNRYDWKFTTKYLAHIEPHKTFSLALPRGHEASHKKGKKQKPATVVIKEEEAMNEQPVAKEEEAMNGVVDGEAEAMDVPLRPEEKRRLNWDNGLYLAPLTTVGNLPFRRLCVDYGATITISEMALAQPLVSGQTEEWALVRRHKSERMFGVQLAGGFPNRMVPTAEVLARELGPSGIDFVDVNMGCPIDLIFNQGAGSALMDNATRLGKILVGMNRALGEIPLTVKFRTGISNTKPNAHKLIPKFVTEWGASAMTLHGRSRQQRYTKLANWEYIRECTNVLRETVADAGLPPVPIFGNGDCYSAQSYYEEKERSGVDGVMVARGALIKPWIFTEIAERREWDISATERLEGIRKFAEYGLSHWGSDTVGVNTTRRFLCEALSFQSRYVPIGLLERMPPVLNERPPAYRGRNELETLLASSYVGDWIKISEMFLGPVDKSFSFAPKHKSSAYGSEEAQG